MRFSAFLSLFGSAAHKYHGIFIPYILNISLKNIISSYRCKYKSDPDICKNSAIDL